MGDIDEEDSVSNGMGLRMGRHGLTNNLVPGSQYGIGLQRDIDLQGLYGFFKDGADRLRFLHGSTLKHQIPSTKYQISSNLSIPKS
jgi:hypothetical protein